MNDPPKYVGRGGWRGGGRPKAEPDEKLLVVSVRMTQAQKDKLGRLGGLPWVREKLDKTHPERAPPATEQARITAEGAERRIVAPVRLTQAQKDKLAALGGAAWLRDRIDRAREAP